MLLHIQQARQVPAEGSLAVIRFASGNQRMFLAGEKSLFQ